MDKVPSGFCFKVLRKIDMMNLIVEVITDCCTLSPVYWVAH